MSTSAESLAAGMKKAARPRDTRDLRQMFDKPVSSPVAVPLRDDAYEIALDHVRSDPDQPRKVFDPESLRELADSIRENGVLQPITVYQSDDSQMYVIITGERRYRAAKLAGLTSISCIVRAHDYDRGAIDQQQLVENIQRADLAPIEAAHALQEFMQRHQYSQRQAARKLGKPLTFVAELLSILKIPDQLLNHAGVDRLTKSTLLEIGRAAASQQHELLRQALVGAPLKAVKERRVNRRAPAKVTYYREYFALNNQPPIEIQWRKHPDEVTREELAAALAEIIRQIVGN